MAALRGLNLGEGSASSSLSSVKGMDPGGVGNWSKSGKVRESVILIMLATKGTPRMEDSHPIRLEICSD